MVRQTMDETLEKELSIYSYAAAKKNLEGMKSQNQRDLKTACNNYSQAYHLSNAVYLTLKGELSLLELKAIGRTMGVQEE